MSVELPTENLLEPLAASTDNRFGRLYRCVRHSMTPISAIHVSVSLFDQIEIFRSEHYTKRASFTEQLSGLLQKQFFLLKSLS